jgi:hypothetical protein
MLAHYAPQVFLYGLVLGVFALAAREYAVGRCGRRETSRTPRCGCPGGSPSEPQVRKPRFKGPKDYGK